MKATQTTSTKSIGRAKSSVECKPRVPARMWLLDEIQPAETSKPAQSSPTADGFSLADEAAKLLDMGAKIAERLNVLQVAEQMAGSNLAPTRTSSRQRANQLRGRMAKFSSIYNAAWMVRHYQHTAAKPLEKAINDFCAVLAGELEQATDKEALLYAVAESLTISPYGVPWEG